MGSADASRPEAETVETTPTPEPTPAPTPEPTPVPTPEATPDPVIASTIAIPAQNSSDETGGEWDLLVAKLKDWLNSNDIPALWSKAQLPLRVIGALIVLTLVLRVYSGILSTIDSLPLAPGLLELTGLIWIVNFGLRNLVRNGDRQRVFEGIRTSWSRVTGR